MVKLSYVGKTLQKTNFYMYRGIHIKSIKALILGKGAMGYGKEVVRTLGLSAFFAFLFKKNILIYYSSSF